MLPETGLEALAGFGVYITLYRLMFHPLANLPGPWLARITTWWLIMQVRKGRSNVLISELHKMYGRIVRLAPYGVLVCSEDAIRTTYGAGTGFTKGEAKLVQLPIRLTEYELATISTYLLRR